VAANTGAARTGTITVSGGTQTLTFTITQAAAAATAVTLLNAATLVAAPNTCTDYGPTVTAFAATDPKVVVAFSVSGQKAGDVPSISYLAPSGQVYAPASAAWAPLTDTQAGYASMCFSDTVSIAGTAMASMPGTWTVNIAWNGVPLKTLTFTISAAACTYSISPTSASPGAAQTTGSVTVTASGASCTWTATSNAPSWITITGGASGTGNGTVTYSVAANTSTSSRTGTITVQGQTPTVQGQTFTVTQANLSPPSAAPLLPSNGVVNAADDTSAMAPGDFLSLYGTNLADAVHQASSLPLPTTLNGVTVDVQAGGQTYAAPLVFVSPGQINCQLPYEATSQVQVRVRNAAGTSAWVSIAVVSSAPRFLTWSQTGAGAVAATSSTYKNLDAKNPAQAGDYVVAYMIGLGQTTPAATTGKPAPDGVSGPLEQVGNVTVTMAGQTVNAAFAGLSPGSVGLYQVNFQVPNNVVAGDYPIQVSVGTAKSQTGATLPAGAVPVTLYNNINPNACSLTSNASFTLSKDAYVSRLEVWYQWAQGETSVNYTASSGGSTVAQGAMTRSACDPNQSSWCLADAPIFATWPASTYTVTLSKAQMCQNTQSSGTGFVNLLGVWNTPAWQTVATGQIGAGGGTVAGGGFSLTAPAGAFSSATNFSVTKSTQPIPSQTSAVTGLYQFQGMPVDIGQPLTVSLDAASSSGLDGEAFLVMSIDDDPSWPVLMVPAKIANGKLTATLPAVAAPPATQSSGGTGLSPEDTAALSPMAAPAAPVYAGHGTILGVTGFVPVASKSGKYAVHYQSGFLENMDYATTVAAMLDQADLKIAATGIEVARRTHIDCYIYSFTWFGRIFGIQKNSEGAYPAGFADTELWGSDQMGLNVNTDLLGQAQGITEVRTTAAHELYHVYQSLYDPRGSNCRKSIQSSPWLWFLEASAEWVANSMANDPNYVSTLAVANFDYFLVRGLDFVPTGLALSWIPLVEDVRSHGYGAATFLEYVDPIGGVNQTEIGKTIQMMAQTSGLIFKNYLYSPLDAWMSQNVFLKDRWLGYLEAYAAGALNRFSTNNSFSMSGLATTTHAQSYNFNSDSDTGTTFNWQAPDMSGALAVINFKNTTTKWATGTPLSLTLPVTDPELEGIVYQRISGKVQLVSTFKDTKVFQNAEVMAARGDTLYVLLANGNANRPFTNTHTFQLVVQVKQPLAALPSLSLSYSGTFLSSTNGSTPVSSGLEAVWSNNCDNISVSENWNGFCPPPFWAPLQWSGNNFSLSFDSGPPPAPAFSEHVFIFKIQGQLDPTRTFVTQLTAHLERNDSAYGFPEFASVEDITFANIPLDLGSMPPSYLDFEMNLAGANVKPHFSYKKTVTYPPYGVDTVTDGEAAYVGIRFCGAGLNSTVCP